MHRPLVVLGLCGWSLGCGTHGPAAQTPAPAAVRPGIDVLLTDSLQVVRGRRVGLVTNQAGVDAQGISDVVRLQAAGVRLVALFSPEHGFRGAAEPGATVASSIDSATGLPIYSLYGRSTAPTDAMLDGVELLLVDLPDAGARYYTYLFTTVEVMRSAARRGIRVVVLDRPDPIGGRCRGTCSTPAFRTPVGMLAVPMRYGMTLGELARLAAPTWGSPPISASCRWRAGGARCRWTRRACRSWRRARTCDRSRVCTTIPGLCLFEGTNLSVGRGSEAPFEQIGAPWLDTAAVLARVRAAALPGVRFAGVTFTPSRPGDGKYADTLLSGIRLQVTDRKAYDPTATAVHLLAAVRAVHAERFGWIPKHFDRLAGGAVLRGQIEAGMAPEAIVRGWGAELERFKERRREFLLYPE